MHTTCPLSKVSLAFLRRSDYEWNGGAPSRRNAVQRKKRWIVNNSSEPVVAGRPRRGLAIACVAGTGAGILLAIAATVYGVMRYVMRYSTGIPRSWWAYWLAYFLALVLTAGYLFWRGSRWVAENPYEMEFGRPPRSSGRFPARPIGHNQTGRLDRLRNTKRLRSPSVLPSLTILLKKRDLRD